MYKGLYEQLPKVNDNTEYNRRKLKLPIKKPLVYKDRWTKKETSVETFEIVEEYNVENIKPLKNKNASTKEEPVVDKKEKKAKKKKKKAEIKIPYWATLKVYLSDKTYVMIHSYYFSHMQKPSFYKDVEEMDKNI